MFSSTRSCIVKALSFLCWSTVLLVDVVAREDTLEFEENHVTLDSTDGASLGLKLKVNREDKVLIITAIEEGLFGKWNDENPSNKVEVKDRIVQVNGIRGDVEALIDECKKKQILEFKVLRRKDSATWKQCRSFTAPSLVPGLGLGVFAATKLEPGSIIEVSPLYLHPDKVLNEKLRSTALAMYMFNYLAPLGSASVFNSHLEPNAQLNSLHHSLSGEAWNNNPDIGTIWCMEATKTILPGEEIFNDYGRRYWQKWNITPATPQGSSASRAATLENDLEKYCSKSVSGVGFDSITRNSDVIPLHYYEQLLRQAPLRDRGWGMVTARYKILPGEVIELAPALLMPTSTFVGTILAPLLIEWSHLSDVHQSHLLRLRKQKQLSLQIIHKTVNDSHIRRQDAWNVSNLALLALGPVAMIERAGDDHTSANCELVLQDVIQSKGEASTVDVELVATKEVRQGELLVLNLPKSGDAGESLALMHHLLMTGQPLPALLTGLPRLRGEQIKASRQQLKMRQIVAGRDEL